MFKKPTEMALKLKMLASSSVSCNAHIVAGEKLLKKEPNFLVMELIEIIINLLVRNKMLPINHFDF